MDPELKASVLWGIIGGLSFLVLVQGYELVASAGVGVSAKVGVALVVAVVAGVATHLARPGFERA